MFEVNPSGVIGDQNAVGNNCLDPSWDPIWQAATHIDSLGWTAEMQVKAVRLGRADLGGGGRPGAGGEVREGKPSVGIKPLTDMTADDRYKGEDGGLYGGGERRHELIALLDEKERRAPRRARSKARKAREQGDQALDLRASGGGGHERRTAT